MGANKTPGWHRLTSLDHAARTATCSVCGPTRFYVKRNGKGHAMPRCATVIRRWKRRSPRSDAERAAAIAAQGGRCAGCGREAVLVDDHDHATGLPRDMLCGGCNGALGCTRDDPAVLRALG